MGGPTGRSFNYNDKTLVALATAHGFLCSQDKQGQWRIETPPGNRQPTQSAKTQAWSLQQEGDRWLLSIEGTPQIWFRISEAIAFLLRWQTSKS